MKTIVIRNDSEIARLLKFADERYVLPFNPLGERLPFRIPQPQPDPAPDVRGFVMIDEPDDVAGFAYGVRTGPLNQAGFAVLAMVPGGLALSSALNNLVDAYRALK